MTKYRYFEKDGAVFRKPADRSDPYIDDVCIRGEWQPYTGDPAAPCYFGNEITAEEAGQPE